MLMQAYITLLKKEGHIKISVRIFHRYSRCGEYVVVANEIVSRLAPNTGKNDLHETDLDAAAYKLASLLA